MRGEEFNNLMDRSRQATREYIVALRDRHEVGVWEGMLSNCTLTFTVDLAGAWTLCTLPRSYSGLLDEGRNDKFESEIAEWETCLRKVVPSQTVFRFDNQLLDQWDVEYDYLLTRYPEAIGRFLAWLPSQDPRYWSRLPAVP